MMNVISGFACQKKFVAEHTIMNKLTGLLLFALPFATIVVDLKYCGLVVCVVVTFASIQEGHYIRTGREVL
jgi:CDP-diacylglycerol--glycerol-3-phosphate 3-phosphatidyltransferase